MNLDTKVTLLEGNPIRMLGEGDRKFSDYIAGVYQREYYQPFELADTPLYQFLSNYENHEAFLLEDGEEILEYNVSLLQSHRNKVFNSECFFGSKNGKLFVYFDDGVLPPATVKAGDAVSCTVGSYGLLTGFVTSESYKTEVKSEGYLLDIDLNIPVGVTGEITIDYDLKDQDSFGFNFTFPKEGHFQVKLRAWTGTTEDVFISEPLEVWEVHEDTIEISVSDPLFDLDLVYPYPLKYRFKGNCYIPKMSGEIETYTDDNGTELNYKAVPQHSKILRGSEIPGWAIHMMNMILSHRIITHEGKRYNVESFGDVENIQWNDLNEYEVTLKLIDDPARREKKKTVVIDAVFNPTSLGFIADGEVKQAAIVSNLNEFELVSKPAFINVSLVNKTLTLTASENSTFVSRSGSVVYKSVKFPSVLASLSISQAAQIPADPDYIYAEPTLLSWEYGDVSAKQVNINASAAYDISIEGDFTVTTHSGYIMVSPANINSTGSTKTGKVTLSIGAIIAEVDLSQKSFGVIQSISPINYTGESGTSLTITADAGTTWSITKSHSWINVGQLTGSGSLIVPIVLENNYGAPRQGYVTVSNILNPGNYFTMNITQTTF
jgi:hypothetical protein